MTVCDEQSNSQLGVLSIGSSDKILNNGKKEELNFQLVKDHIS